MDSQAVIDQFFVQDGQVLPNGKIKKSVLLSLVEDFKFSILLPGKWRDLEHTVEQKASLQSKLPSFTIVSLFCTGVDVLAKVTQKRVTPPRQNRQFFIQCAIDWFELTQEEADKLWELRNCILHAYRLHPHSILEEFGHGRIIRQSPDGQWFYYLRAMFTTLTKTKDRIYEHLKSEGDLDKELTANYLETNGFIYTF